LNKNELQKIFFGNFFYPFIDLFVGMRCEEENGFAKSFASRESQANDRIAIFGGRTVWKSREGRPVSPR
jgi:hypothetical protein